jgi:probable phosphoglycerate mutase
VLRWRGRDPHWEPEGGESLACLRERIVNTTAELAQRHPDQQIVLVAHGGVLDMLYRCANGLDVQAARTWQLGNATINRLIWRPSGMELVQWCDARHLENGALDELST